jgi:transcription antitermination factor NusG
LEQVEKEPIMSDEKRQWHSWVIKRNRLDNVVSYIKENCPEIDKFFYPFIKKEYQTKKGVTRIKDMPLYEGYLFLRYHSHPQVFHKLSQYPQVTTYCGPVSEVEIEKMQAAQGKLISELKASRFKQGDTVILKDGPFKGWEAKVVSLNGTSVKVKIDAVILGSAVQEVVYPEEQLERKTELQNSEVQDIL